ncbi:hypothetical protein [Sediminitomix flava]|uniref:Uncharacterized protein n=1 Tax=Sediminitomix flava TaxID=379075 RepID=A0A315Z7T9_SEDFL|nr:hypothetical protein [Sediminitomix flava]PWJ39106.1 hypothetical protein BC781_1067 [Sediminitomix flava]
MLRKKLFWFLGLESIFLFGLLAYSYIADSASFYQQEKVISQHYLLTDFCLTTESRHTRHLSMPETIAPFQDLPGFHDHFPSSSFFQAPKWLSTAK